jgi:mannose-6-phosphate isomerase-like protein (cupin superfamily)
MTDLGQQAIDEADRLVPRGRLRSPFVIRRLIAHDDTSPMVQVMELAERSRPIALRSPFEDCESIAGGMWTAQEVFVDPREDGLAKLRFAPGTNALPAHIHEHSDRCLFVLEGEGLFHASPCDWRSFDGTGIASVPVRAGDVVVFNRGVLHTFSALRRELVLVRSSPKLYQSQGEDFCFCAPPRSCTSRRVKISASSGQACLAG